MVDELQVGAVGFDLQVERTGGFYGVDVSVCMAFWQCLSRGYGHP